MSRTEDSGGVMTQNGASETDVQQQQKVQKMRKPFLGISNPILSEAASIATLVAIVLLIRSSIFSIYVIPTGSMLPTIKIDDRVFANKLAFGLMLPFTETQLISWDTPQRGDIVLFKSPIEDQTFVKRVVGIGGDRISLQNGVLTINGTVAKETLQSDRSIMHDMGGEDDPESKNLYREKLLEIPEHYVLKSKAGGVTFYETRTFSVPEGKIFLMGDNRDGSNDSRSWGFVQASQVYGRASFVLYSTERNSEGFWPKFRTDRFFHKLNP